MKISTLKGMIHEAIVSCCRHCFEQYRKDRDNDDFYDDGGGEGRKTVFDPPNTMDV